MCLERPQGPCEQLEEAACTARPDCEAMYSDACGDGNAREAEDGNEQPARRPAPQDPCGCL